MFRILLGEVAGPLARRAGTMLSGLLAGFGVASDTLVTIELGVVALLLVLVDLATSYAWRKTKGVK